MPSRISWARDAWSVPSVIFTAIGVFICMIVPAVAYVSIAYGTGVMHSAHDQGQLLIAQAVTYVPWAIFLLAVLPRIGKTTTYELGLRAPTPRDIAIGIVGAIVMWLSVTLLGSALVSLSHTHETETAIALLHDLSSVPQKILYALIAIVFAPMLEELTFRVFLFSAFTRYFSVPLSALLSAIVFGLVHASPKSVADIGPQLLTISLPLVLGGFVLAYVYATTRSYWASVTTHALFNSVTVVAIMAFHAS